MVSRLAESLPSRKTKKNAIELDSKLSLTKVLAGLGLITSGLTTNCDNRPMGLYESPNGTVNDLLWDRSSVQERNSAVKGYITSACVGEYHLSSISIQVFQATYNAKFPASYLTKELDGKMESIVDIPTWTSRATLDAIGEAAFSYQFNSLDNGDNELANAFNNLCEII
ncbi:uncharacterized protein EV420DRAFT_1477807 [Desarmillaria tabescens]|uniref:Uncharacterized protein n=1 Tax=Armillaria tabescens TaxID=1929756 RepID=A0AA39N8D9_ARMTA|nr:uncharacterized protein EV420DRAFT_1477807 [Desarmillaria tabescens]KAK0460925.1 hypothetical protein EV420DRAFT_1477807 [Desarmillaria tabescens]